MMKNTERNNGKSSGVRLIVEERKEGRKERSWKETRMIKEYNEGKKEGRKSRRGKHKLVRKMLKNTERNNGESSGVRLMIEKKEGRKLKETKMIMTMKEIGRVRGEGG